MGDYEDGETIRAAPECKHFFHDKCIMDWVKAKIATDEILCPLCNTKL